MAPWYEEAEFYHIYPIGLTGAPRKNESEETVHRFSTLEQWLPHIADLGCTAIYIGPLFESTTHGYDTKDYKQVDRRLGDNADFAAYVKKAHELGIKVVVRRCLQPHRPRILCLPRHSGKKRTVPVLRNGTKESGSAETPAITTDSPTKHGETASNSST